MDLSRLSVNRLAEYTGKDRRTIKRRLRNLKPGPDRQYDSAEALRAIYDAEQPNDLEHQQARLNAARANVAEIQEAAMRAELVPAAEVVDVWRQIVANASETLRAMVPVAARAVYGVKDLNIAEAKLTAVVHDTLHRLADFEPAEPKRRNH